MRFSRRSAGSPVMVALVAALAGFPALGGPEHRLISEGNEAFAREEFEAAAAHYQQALDKAPTLSEAAYNRACALVALEQFDLVPDLLRTADLYAPTDDARGRARYNLGAAFYRAGQAMTAEDPKEAIGRFKAAAAAFKAAVRVNAEDVEAKKALELSRRAIKLIEDQLAMPQNLRDLANDQRQQGEQGEGQQEGEQGEGDAPPPQEGEQGQQGEQGEKGQQGAQGQAPGGRGRDRAQEMRETIEQARDQGVQTDPQNQPGAEQDIREAEEAMKGGSPEDAARELDEAAEKLERAQQQQQQQSQQQGDQQRGENGQEGDEPGEDGPESESAVDHIIKQLLEKERDERERRMQYLNPRRPVRARVDKDW